MKKFFKSSLVISMISSTLGLVGPVAVLAAGPATVNLLSAGNFTILSKAGITNTGSHTSLITGNIGTSPITAASMSNVFCSEITGTIYGVDAAYVGSGNQTCFLGNPPLSNKTLIDNAVLDMGIAYTDAAGKTNPTATELGTGNIGGMTLAPGLYKWSTDLTIPTNITLSGSANDVWIFQIAGDLNIASAGSVASGVKVILAGGAQASNIFWQVGGVTGATLGTYSTFNGNILTEKQIIMETGAVLYGKALAQTQVTLDSNTVSAPSNTIMVSNPAPVTTNTTTYTSGGVSYTYSAPSSTTPTPDNTYNNSGYGFTASQSAANSANVNANTTSAAASASASAFGQLVRMITISLAQGSRGSNVTTLQQFLISQNKGPSAQALASVGATAYFGAMTRAALAEFQAKVGVSPALGNFGPITRAYLSANY